MKSEWGPMISPWLLTWKDGIELGWVGFPLAAFDYEYKK